MLNFQSQVTIGADMAKYTDEEIKNEPMFFNCSILFALKEGGPITKEFISHLPDRFIAEGILDSRVHMLMPGWYPCIPGWHHDDVPRSTLTGQPNYIDPEYHSLHCLALVNSDVAPTEFMISNKNQSIKVPTPDPSRVTYEHWNEYLTLQPQGKTIQAGDKLYFFDCDTFHRGTAAIKSGWRWFGRVSINTDRKPTNETRRQTQVYMSAVNAGW